MTDHQAPCTILRTLLLATAVTLAAGVFTGPRASFGAGAAFAQADDRGDDRDDRGEDRGDDGRDDAGDDGNDGAGGGAGGGGNDDADDGADDAGDAASDGDDGSDRPASRNRSDDGEFRVPENRRTPGRQTARTGNAASTAAPRPISAPGEIVVTNLGSGDLAALQAQGFAVIERLDLSDVAVVLHRLRVPDRLTLELARDRVRALPTGGTADFNHFYRSEQDGPNPAASPGTIAEASDLQTVALPAAMPCTHLNCAIMTLIGWPSLRDSMPQCQVTVPVGVIDTGVNAKHETLHGADLEVLRLVAEQVDASKAVHGTAVAALLVGQQPDRAPGLIPEARLIVVDIFGRDGDDERASAASLVLALDLLSQRRVRVINLSLAGPANATLEAALTQITANGAVVLAAAGNGGPGAAVSYPAGYPSVLAVTAVDQRGQVYRRAQRGAHLDVAAPGVDVWSATSISGVKPKTGTSFAVPFATAVAAVLVSRDPAVPPDLVAAQVRLLVRDIGAPGPDEVFGAGLLSLDTLCRTQIVAAPAE